MRILQKTIRDEQENRLSLKKKGRPNLHSRLLSSEQISEIFKKYATGTGSRNVAKHYGVEKTVINNIINHKYYTDGVDEFMETCPFDGMMGTFSGRMFDFFNPCVDNIEISDIVRSLTFKCRWNGMCKEFYSVAEHSLRVAALSYCIAIEKGFDTKKASSYYAYGLIHDFSEAYTGDVISPIKKVLIGFHEIEEKIQKTIEKFFNLESPNDDIKRVVKQADIISLIFEAGEVRPHPFNRYILPKIDITDLEREAGKRLESTKNIEINLKESLYSLKKTGRAKIPKYLITLMRSTYMKLQQVSDNKS